MTGLERLGLGLVQLAMAILAARVAMMASVFRSR
jgi:hypothetical protein